MPASTDRSQYSYLYPNAQSYNQIPAMPFSGGWYNNGRALRHGYIFGYKASAASRSTGTFGTIRNILGDAAEAARAARQIDYSNCKIFQFNPSALIFNVGMMAADNPDDDPAGGALPSAAVGVANTRLELLFDRTDEIAKSNNGVGGTTWRDLGVQVDLFDLLKVISGGDEGIISKYKPSSFDADSPFPGAVQAGSTNSLTSMMIDSAVTGSKVYFRSFAVIFNANLAVHVLNLSSFAYSYLRFTANLVPTMLKVEMELEITNMGTAAQVTSGGQGGPTTTTDTPPLPPSVREALDRVPGINF